MSNVHMIKAKDKTKWYEPRKKLAIVFVNLARRIYPECPEVIAFHMGMMQDCMITGKAVIKINPDYLHEEKDSLKPLT